MAINITRGLDRLLGFVLLSLTLFILLTTKAAAGTIVYFEASGDYQGEEPFTERSVSFPVPEGVAASWLSLEDASELLPIEYSVRDGSLYLSGTGPDAARFAQRRFKLDGTWDDMVCSVSGKLYASPWTLKLVLGSGYPNLAPDTIYCYCPGDAEPSDYIDENWNEGFKAKIDQCLFALWKKAPEDYYFTVDTLERIRQDDADTEYAYATAYVWPGAATCYVVKANVSTLKLASILAHEAKHVAFYRYWLTSEETGSYSEASEQAAREYQAQVYARLTGTTEQAPAK